MSGAFWASYVALWVLVCLLVVALLALYNHFGQIYISSREGRAAHGPAEGSTLPNADARDTEGHPITLPVPNRQALMLFAATDCPLCNELKPDLGRFAREHDECEVLVVCGGGREEVVAWGRDLPEQVVVLPDKTSKIASGYGISLTPFLVVTSPTGVVLTRGLVNAKADLEMALSIAQNGHRPGDEAHAAGGVT